MGIRVAEGQAAHRDAVVYTLKSPVGEKGFQMQCLLPPFFLRPLTLLLTPTYHWCHGDGDKERGDEVLAVAVMPKLRPQEKEDGHRKLAGC